ncbi:MULTISPECIES: AAA family ATPase [Bacteroides]|mgnify:CR=1 FL=1|uniref:AAA family ATPase n=1 Tax=Bacteroides TaxID=816 RepID=UPI001DE6621E|nr:MULTISPECIES: AAA family ATPase [Bacteroides]HJD91083.1 AAA family ATPase [Bacteroides coprosuis]
MEEKAKYIKRIEIKNLWNRLTVKWDLRPDVNILAGINGVGKTTILNRVISFLEEHEGEKVTPTEDIEGVNVYFDSPQAQYIPYNVIRSYDRPLMVKEVTSRVDRNVRSELDWQLYLLQRKYLDYQVNVGNRMIECLGSNDPDVRAKAIEIAHNKTRFQDIVDELFSYTHKKIDRTRNEIVFNQRGKLLLPYQLSSGEKQMLLILLTTLVQDFDHFVLLMDEPEASLHIEWQQKLISIIRELNPNAQLILTTHSPAVIMEGWLDAVTEVSDISTLKE